MLTREQKKSFRLKGQGLHPIVMIGAKGLTDAVIKEADRALNDHELIKMKIAIGDREERKSVIATLCEQLQAVEVQHIGRVLLIYRKRLDAVDKQ